jgi:hypothetical protein
VPTARRCASRDEEGSDARGIAQKVKKDCIKVVVQFEIPVNSNQERISRKGAKAQRKNAKLLSVT